MARRRTIDRRKAKGIARERMDILFNRAREVFPQDRKLARRYVTLARRIGMRYNVGLTKKDKLDACKNCNSFLVPGINCRVRTHAARVVITCLECGHVRRVPFTRERKGKLNKHPLRKPLSKSR
ncbi:MAG: ribonuclease P [Candidatus Dadabacteria bacterium]|nr:ribonuclease P [Candidatus Dadabacteria bacterium]